MPANRAKVAALPAELTGRTRGDLVVHEPSGRGGFGAVYRAQQRGLGRDAVVKAMRADEPGLGQRFLRECRLASRLDHPYAAHIYAYGAEPDGVLWIAMELVGGTPLHPPITARGPAQPA